jgi:hypothetical protein
MTERRRDPNPRADRSAGDPDHLDGPEPAPSSADVTVERGALGAVTAEDVFVSLGAVGAARADKISVELGAVGAAAAGDLRLSTGVAGLVVARDARFEQAIVRTLVARRVTLGRGSAAGIVFAVQSEGPGRPVLDWRGGLAAGTIVALAWLVARRLR